MKIYKVSQRRLIVLAILVWYVGAFIMILKGTRLWVEARTIDPQGRWLWYSLLLALFLGSIKAKFLFVISCRKNLARISALTQPKIWQFFSPQFFMALTLMITAGVILSRTAHNNYPFLLVVATIDISIATALLVSSVIFWREVAIAKRG